jgi:CRP-like cAMP-binding protein
MKMPNLEKVLKNCQLFKGFEDDEISNILSYIGYREASYEKNQVIALEGDVVCRIGIIIEGSIEAQKTYPSGHTVTIARMKIGDIFGEAIIFSSTNKYPATIISTDHSRILFLSVTDVMKLCSSNMAFLNNFMGLLSNKILMLNEKLKALSYQTLREKIASYLIDEYNKLGSPMIELPLSRKEMAEHFGTTRPSLSRELANMKRDGLIDYYRDTVKITDMDGLEAVLYRGHGA